MQDMPCSSCHFLCKSDWYFCPNCGKPLKDKPLSTGIAKQLVIYSVSFFLTPFGLGWAIQYMKSSNPKARIIGIVALFLTFASIGLMIWTAKSFMDSYMKQINDVLPSGL
jgi:hypothetical protein